MGDLAWLTVPPAATQAVVHKISQAKSWKNKHVADDGKMLVKIGRIHSDIAAGASQSSLTVRICGLYTADGRIEGSFSIDHLTRCYPPPEATVYATVNCEMGPDKLDKKQFSMSLTMMYRCRKYLTLLSLRIEAHMKKERHERHGDSTYSGAVVGFLPTARNRLQSVTVGLTSVTRALWGV